jgi:hypothetical protein
VVVWDRPAKDLARDVRSSRSVGRRLGLPIREERCRQGMGADLLSRLELAQGVDLVAGGRARKRPRRSSACLLLGIRHPRAIGWLPGLNR